MLMIKYLLPGIGKKGDQVVMRERSRLRSMR
jgi:hypothetical protein